jgi:HSP20 family protein
MTNEIENPDPRATKWNDLDLVVEDLRQRFWDAFGLPQFGLAFRSGESAEPETALRPARTDVTDTGAAYRIVAEVPGIPKEQLDVRVRGASVEIRGEHAKQAEKNGEATVYRERAYSGYYRRVELPEPVIATDAKAKIENGVLELELPKQHPSPTPSEVKVAVQ